MTLSQKADISLIVVAIVWGITFLPISEALKSNGVFVILFWLFFISGIFMSFVAIKFSNKFDLNSIRMGFFLGTILFIAFALQTFALKLTFSSTVAFITGLECVIVPFISVIIFKQRVSIYAIIGVFVAILGLWWLSNAKFSLGIGEFLALLCAIFYALYTVLNGEFVRKCELYILVSIVFFTIATFSFISAFIFEDRVFPVLDMAFYRAIFITVIFGTLFCYFVQTAMQRHTTATKTALFFSLEPVSAGFIGYYFGKEILSPLQIFGASLIILGALISECGTTVFTKKSVKI